MTYYICEFQNDSGQSFSLLWKIEGNIAIRAGVPNAKNIEGCYCEAKAGVSIFDSIALQLARSKPVAPPDFYPIELHPGQYYPRMARPNEQHFHESPGQNPGEHLNRDFVAMAIGQLNVLVRQLENICQIVHPTAKTFNTYGHTIRNLLILACTEIETHWRGILVDNGFVKSKYSTKDYALLQHAMRLNEYSVSFPNYPWLPSIQPFSDWDENKPTRSLLWYDSYNAVKHNREGEFERATLRHAFESLAACAIMMIAQFGLHFDGWHSSDASRFFNFDKCPKWTPSDVYIFPYEQAWANSGTVNWTPISYPFIQT